MSSAQPGMTQLGPLERDGKEDGWKRNLGGRKSADGEKPE